MTLMVSMLSIFSGMRKLYLFDCNCVVMCVYVCLCGVGGIHSLHIITSFCHR